MTDASQTGNAFTRFFNFNQRLDRRQTIILSATVVIAIFLVLLIAHLTAPKPAWARPDLPSVTASVSRGQNLATFSAGYGQPTVIMAMANSGPLKIDYDQTCTPKRRLEWPHFFCNDGLNLREANTLDRNQRLRVLAMSPTLPQPIMQIAANVPAGKLATVLVEGSTQKNLDHGAAIAYALLQRGELGGIWVYGPDRIAEFVHAGRATTLNAGSRGLQGALEWFKPQNVDRLVVVTGANVDTVRVPNGMQPIIGYCMTSACEPGMQAMVTATNGQYVPH